MKLDKIMHGIMDFKYNMGDVQILYVDADWKTMELTINYISSEVFEGEKTFIYKLN